MKNEDFNKKNFANIFVFSGEEEGFFRVKMPGIIVGKVEKNALKSNMTPKNGQNGYFSFLKMTLKIPFFLNFLQMFVDCS